jgi:NAD(P)-dependent dehydrogenase (short-subunit alcohol dehydrogenase family)
VALVALDEFRRVLEGNLLGAVAMTQALLPLLRAAQPGRGALRVGQEREARVSGR